MAICLCRSILLSISYCWRTSLFHISLPSFCCVSGGCPQAGGSRDWLVWWSFYRRIVPLPVILEDISGWRKPMWEGWGAFWKRFIVLETDETISSSHATVVLVMCQPISHPQFYIKSFIFRMHRVTSVLHPEPQLIQTSDPDENIPTSLLSQDHSTFQLLCLQVFL